MLEERYNYLYILFIKNDIAKSLSYEEAIKDYANKTYRKKSIIGCVRQLINKNNRFFFHIF